MEQSNAPAARPGFLTVLCILSYIGSGIWALFSLLGIFMSSMIMSWIGMGVKAADTGMHQAADSLGMNDTATTHALANMDKAVDTAAAAASTGVGIVIGAFVVSLLLAVISIMGVMKMWQMKKAGFFMYVAANGLVFIGAIYMSMQGMGWGLTVITAAFLSMYAINLKHLK